MSVGHFAHNFHKNMVVMDSVTAAAAAAAAAASEAAASDVHRVWYESAALGQGGHSSAAASATASDDFTDAYFKGQNAAYISQMSSYHHGMGQGRFGLSRIRKKSEVSVRGISLQPADRK